MVLVGRESRNSYASGYPHRVRYHARAGTRMIFRWAARRAGQGCFPPRAAVWLTSLVSRPAVWIAMFSTGGFDWRATFATGNTAVFGSRMSLEVCHRASEQAVRGARQ